MKMAVLLKENASRPVELWLGGTHHAHLSVWNRTLVDFKQINEHPDAQRRHLSVWYQSLFDFKQINEPRSYTPDPIPDPVPQIRCAIFCVESFICLKSMIGRFQTDEWSLWGRSSWKWLFYWRKTRCALIFSIYIKKHAEIEFYLHKDFCAAGIEFYLHKDFRAAEIEFYLHKEFLRKFNEYIK